MSEAPKERYVPSRGTPQYQISQPDLEELERVIPELYSIAMEKFTRPRQRRQWNRVKDILSNVRWHYCPATEVEIIPVDDDEDDRDGSSVG